MVLLLTLFCTAAGFIKGGIVYVAGKLHPLSLFVWVRLRKILSGQTASRNFTHYVTPDGFQQTLQNISATDIFLLYLNVSGT
jgi:hypothetical protein